MPVFQQQYPLSPWKFWKKMLTRVGSQRSGVGYQRSGGGILGLIVLIVIAGPLIGQMLGFSSVTNDLSGQYATSAIVAAVVLVAYLVGKACYVSAYIRRYFYDVSDDAVTIRKGVFTPTEIHVLWNKVQDVYVDQDFLDRLMGLYDVHLASATATSGIEAHIDGVSAATAEGLKEYLLGRIRAQGTPPAATIGSMPPATPIAVPQGVSSIAYPIVGKWLVIQALSLILTWIVIAVIVGGTAALLAAGSQNPGLVEYAPWILAGVAVLFAISFFFQILWLQTFYFELGPDYLTKREGVIARSEKHVPYRTIQDVVISQSVLERIFGIAHVTIQNATQGALGAGSLIIPGQPLAKANELSGAIRGVVKNASSYATGV